jgi:hypothetical protein
VSSDSSKKSQPINARYPVGSLRFLDDAAGNANLKRAQFIVTSGAPLVCLFNEKTFSETLQGLKLQRALARLNRNIFLLTASDWPSIGITQEEWNGFIAVYLKIDAYLASKKRKQHKEKP